MYLASIVLYGGVFMQNVRLKCSIDENQVANRLLYQPEIVELQLVEQDIYRPDKIYETIQKLKQHHIIPYLHHPSKYKGVYLDILSDDNDNKEFYIYSSKVLSEICRQEKVHCVIHAHYSGTVSSILPRNRENSVRMRHEIEKIMAFEHRYFLWENTIEGLFSHKNEYLLEEIITPLQLPLCFDISHSFISLQGNNDKLAEKLHEFAPLNHYFHVVDSLGQDHDSLCLGKGNVNWNLVKPFIDEKPFIFEIGLPNFNDCTPMMESVQFYNNL